MFSFVPRSQGLCGGRSRRGCASRAGTTHARPSLGPGHRSGAVPSVGARAPLPGEGLSDTRRLLRPQGHQEGGAGRPLHECAECRGVPAPHDLISLPVAGLRTAPAHSPMLPSVPKRLKQFPLSAPRGALPVRVDRFMRDTHRGGIRILRLQPPGHRLRRPALRQRRVHVGLEGQGRQERPRSLGQASRDVLSSRGPVGAPGPLRPADRKSVV